MEVDITYGSVTVRLGGVATHCGPIVQPDSPSGVQIISYTYGVAGTAYQVINPAVVNDNVEITSTVPTGTWLEELDSLVVLFIRDPRPTPTPFSGIDEALAIVVVPYAVDPSEATTRIRPTAIGSPSTPAIAAMRAQSLMFDTTTATTLPSVIDIDALPTTWGTFGNDRPDIDDYLAQFAGFCGELWKGWGTASWTPSQQHPGYGRSMGSLTSEALLMALSTDDSTKRRELARRLTQWGVDLFGAFHSGRNDQVDGGHYQGRKALIVFAGHCLEQSWVDATSVFPGQFNEDEQFFEAAPAWVWGWPYGYLGRTEFPTELHLPIASWDSVDFFYLTGYFEHVCGVQLGTALAMRLLGLTSEMGVAHDGMMAQWMEGPSPSDLAAMESHHAPLGDISWGTSYSAWGCTDFARAAWEEYSDVEEALEATGAAGVRIDASGAAALNVGASGGAAVPVAANATAALTIAAHRAAATAQLSATGAAGVQIAASGQPSVWVSATGAITLGAAPALPTSQPPLVPKVPSRGRSGRGSRFAWRPPWH